MFHLAAQVAVTTSLADPREDFDVNLRRHAGRARRVAAAAAGACPLIFASTNKVYGDLADIAARRATARPMCRPPELRAHGIGEDRPLDFHTPYGCSKGAADQYVLDYARSFGVPTAVLRMSCIYGPRQLGTEDQGWVAHFLSAALARQADQHLRRRPPGARHSASSMTPSTPISPPGAGSTRVRGPGLQPGRRAGATPSACCR